MTFAAALLRLILCVLGPVAIWFSWRWTGSADGPVAFAGFIEAARALAAFGAAAFLIASAIAVLRLGGDTLIARLARAAHASGWLILFVVMIGPNAYLIAPLLGIAATDIHDLLRPKPHDGLSAHGKPMAVIGQVLALAAGGLPLLAALLDWTGSEIALTVWIALLWLAAAFKLHRFLPRRLTD
ncbi:hypothetical protein AWH62_14920 [Maricaulis sp. W15]|uniref:hypothetical protein n=1 Tax=Maricaulis sp. W15 TaxID=1772333 RepID=UPI000948B412|nr:hypothetical protein [Maricaulis sp. W15]OLF80639.1 hypothetical protein AWH62_14920 [Maricaulis sp. W15]